MWTNEAVEAIDHFCQTRNPDFDEVFEAASKAADFPIVHTEQGHFAFRVRTDFGWKDEWVFFIHCMKSGAEWALTGPKISSSKAGDFTAVFDACQKMKAKLILNGATPIQKVLAC